MKKTLRTTELSVAQYQEVLRQDFCAFIQRCFTQLNPRTKFLTNWHIQVIAVKLELFRLGKIKRLTINVPPRHLKSICASIAFAAWCLGHDPATQILCVSYAQDLSDRLAADSRTIMNSPWYQALFRTRPISRRQPLQEFETKEHGYRLATSVGGVLTGRGADIIIIDDPIKPEEALSQSQRRAVNQWYDHTLYSRLNDKQQGCIIQIMQRLHEDDLVGHVLEQERWEVLSFPAIAEKDEKFVIETPYGVQRYRRRQGDVLHPERESRDTLKRILRTIGEYNFASQYQQTPAPLGGGMVKTDWFKWYSPNELPDRFDQIVQSWDTANKVSQLSDYSVCTTWGIEDGHLYLLDVLRKRLEYPALKRAVREQCERYGATVVLIEDRASGTQLIQELIKEGLSTVKAYTPEGSKIMRMNAQTATIENGFVHLPREAPWLADFLHELAAFPFAKNDDQADSTSQALAWFNQVPPKHWLFDYYREDIALGFHRQGYSLEAIAVQVQRSPDQVQRWITDHNTGSANQQTQNMRFKICASCRGDIFYNLSSCERQGDLYYHPQCLRKLMFGT
jgi:predicted phage terminase large subunit-like protein